MGEFREGFTLKIFYDTGGFGDYGGWLLAYVAIIHVFENTVNTKCLFIIFQVNY